MGDLPDFRTDIMPPFSCVLMDLFGPIWIKDDCVKRGPRIKKKVWGVVFSCSSTRAVYIDVAVNYNTESILHCIRRLMSLRGNIKTIVSDPGSQLVGAANELKSWRKGWSESELVQFGAKNGINWQFVMASSQHQTGGVEIMVKLVKGVMKTLVYQLGNQVLTLNELNTVLHETSNLVNSRPLGIKPNSDTSSEFLCPNSLLLGRNADQVNSGPFNAKHKADQGSVTDLERFKLVQEITKQFWEVWTKNYFPTLLVRKKWHFSKRNMQVGDLCLLQDANQLRGEFRRCRISNVYPDKHGNVRNVEVLASPKQDGSVSFHPQGLSRLRRHVSNLILLQPVEENETNSDLETNTLTNSSYTCRNLEIEAPSGAMFLESDVPVSYSSPAGSTAEVEGAHQVPKLCCKNGYQQQYGEKCWGLDCQSMQNMSSSIDEEVLDPEELLRGSVKLETQQSTSCPEAAMKLPPAHHLQT